MGEWYCRRKTDAQVGKEAVSVMKQMQVVADLHIKGSLVDHQLGSSIHPFDVVSWDKEGNDGELENTLQMIAQVADVKVKDLAEDLISTRSFVLKEVQAGNDLLESWKKTVDVFKGRLKALPTVLYAVIATWRGTGALESWFHIGRSQNCKKKMTDVQGTARMRIRINGPSLEEFCKKRVVQGQVKYEPGAICLLAQSLYAGAYGTQSGILREFHHKLLHINMIIVTVVHKLNNFII